MRAGVSVPVRACRGVGMGAVVSSRVYMSAFVWVRGCPGVRTYACVGVFFFLLKRCIFPWFCTFPAHTCLLFHCINNTRHNTIHIDHCTPCLDPFAAVWLFSGFSGVFLTVPGAGSRMDTDVDLEVQPCVQPDKAPKSGYLRCRHAPVTPLTSSRWTSSTEGQRS